MLITSNCAQYKNATAEQRRTGRIQFWITKIFRQLIPDYRTGRSEGTRTRHAATNT